MYSDIFELEASLFKALAHSRRLEIIQLLGDQELPVTDIHSMLDLPQANISQHLSILKEANIVETRKDGKHIFYRISDKRVREVVGHTRPLVIDWQRLKGRGGELDIDLENLVPLVHDPVCKMRLSPKTASFTNTFENEKYFFCASGCLKVFKDNPEKYVYPKK